MNNLFVVSLLIIQSCMAFAQPSCENDDTAVVHNVQNTIFDSSEDASFSESFPLIENKIRQLYENEIFFTRRDSEFNIEDICTADFLKRLSDANDMDGGGYATWMLRSGEQDGDDTPSKVLSVIPGDNGAITVNWLDMGHRGSTTFILVKVAGLWKINDATVPDGFNPL